MKKTIICMLIFMFFFTLTNLAISQVKVSDIIKRSAQAMGGKKLTKTLESIRLSIIYPGHGPAVISELKKPQNMKSISRGGTHLSIINDKGACFLRKSKGSKHFDKLIHIKQIEMPDFVAEPGLFLFYYFDFPVEFAGIKNISNKKVYLLKVKMSQSVIMDYYIDYKTYLPVKTVAHVLNKGKWGKWSRVYSNYKKVDGINYPHSFSYSFNDGKKIYHAEIAKLEINPVFPDDHFNIPKELPENNLMSDFDVKSLKIKWIKIPAGKFKMGSDVKNRMNNENPVHWVELDTYNISKHEITVGQFRKFVQDTNYITEVEKKGIASVKKDGKWQKDKNANWEKPGFKQKDDHPVVLITSGDAEMFCKWLSKKTGKNILLPTEAQWEKAARGSDGRTYPWGNSKLSGDKLNCSDINIKIKSGDKGIDDDFAYTSPVGTYPAGASVYNVMDMAGNVWEWCRDLYQKDYYSRSVNVNPKGPKTGNGNTFRGGSWYCGPKTVRTTVRGGHGSEYNDFGLGFRIVLEN